MVRGGIAAATAVVLATLSAGCVGHTAASAASTTGVASGDAQLLSGPRLAALPVPQRAAWIEYVERSSAQHARDTASMNAELRSIGRTAMTRAPYGRGFEVTSRMTPSWFATDSARRIAANIISFQAPNGGWSKHVDMAQHARQKGESYFAESEKWQWISTLDNGSTTEQLRFLGLADSARSDGEYRAAFLRGMEFLLKSQFPNGCWPQIWPLQGSYHDAATFNDDAAINAASLLRDVANGAYPFVTPPDRERARSARDRAIQCLLDSQTRVDGKLTVWGQQHDPITLRPTSARSYELASLTAQESANIIRFLIRIPSPDARVVSAVHSAADWFKATQTHGYTYDFEAGRKDAPGAGPLWARMYELGTNRPIFSDRNGIKLYDWNQLVDRRTGYGWYTYAPVLALRQYENWARKNPRAETSR